MVCPSQPQPSGAVTFVVPEPAGVARVLGLMPAQAHPDSRLKVEDRRNLVSPLTDLAAAAV